MVCGGLARTCDLRRGVVADRVWREYYSAGSGELWEGSVVGGRTIFWTVALVRLPELVVCGDEHE